MDPTDYWIEVRRRDGGVLGAGFYLTRRYVLTAEHCLQDLGDAELDVTLVHEDGTEAPGRVCERRKDMDLALIILVGKSFVRPPVPQRCDEKDRWRTPNRPTAADPHLVGVVNDPKVKYDCVGGAQLEALELRTEVELGSYSGYSGSAVERTSPERGPAGVLLEQYPDRENPMRATNVLFAATIENAFRTFADYFDAECLNWLRPVQEAPPRPAAPDMTEALGNATSLLEQVAVWRSRELMGPDAANMIELQVGRSLIEEFIKRGSL